MRHASLRSGDAYAASTEVFVNEILAAGNARIIQLIEGADLSRVCYMSEIPIDRDDRIRQVAERLFIEAKHVGELTCARVLELAGEKGGQCAFDRVFPGEEFESLRQSWLLQRIEDAMATAFAAAEN